MFPFNIERKHSFFSALGRKNAQEEQKTCKKKKKTRKKKKKMRKKKEKKRKKKGSIDKNFFFL